LVRVVVESILAGGFPAYNPVMLVGPPGSGKTHLAAGLVGSWRQRCGQRSAVYVPAVDFAREWTDAVEAQSTEEFHNRYRRPELVAIDDVDVLGEKPSAQQELLHTVDALVAAGSRLVLTGVSPPGGISGMIPSLQSRLIGGLVVPLALPSRAVRLAAARKFAEVRGFQLSEEAAVALADALPEPLSALWAAVLHLELSARLEAGKATEQQAREYLARRASAEPSLRDIAAATARHFSLRLADLRSASRRRAVVVARDVAMYLARTLTGKSFEQIGTYFNGRDHSTVSHGCTKTAELLQSDPGLRSAVDQLRQQVRAT
jgi:chromosomal replication initiator protein